MATKKLIEYWKTENKLYDNYPMYCHYATQKMFDGIVKHTRNKKVLEIGCGHGGMIKYFAKNGAKSFGIDISPEATGYTKNKGIISVQADCRNIPFKEDSFDIVFSLGVVEHFNETIGSIKEHIRICKSGGTVIIIVPNVVSLSFIGAYFWQKWRWGLRFDSMTSMGKAYTKSQFKKMIPKKSCKNIDVFTYFGSSPLKIFTKKLNTRLADIIEGSIYSRMFGHLLIAVIEKK